MELDDHLGDVIVGRLLFVEFVVRQNIRSIVEFFAVDDNGFDGVDRLFGDRCEDDERNARSIG